MVITRKNTILISNTTSFNTIYVMYRVVTHKEVDVFDEVFINIQNIFLKNYSFNHTRSFNHIVER